MRIGIATAMDSERAQIRRLLENASEAGAYSVGAIGRNEVVLAATGIGKVNAAIGAVEMIRGWRPDCLVSTGVAGGIDPSLAVMDVVAGAEVAYHDVDCGPGNEPGQVQGLPVRFAGDPALLACAKDIRTETKIAAGLICSGDQFISERARLDDIKARYPDGLAVDMESGALAQTCHIYGIPFLSFRILSDTPGAKDHFGQYLNFWSTMAERSFAVTKAFLESIPPNLFSATGKE